MLTNLAGPISNEGNEITLRYSDYIIDRLGVMAHKVEKDASENNKMHDCAMCNFFRKSESSKYRYKRFGYPDPYPVPI